MCLLDDGKLHKAINANDKMHIIEEMILFPEPQPVQHIELDPQRVNHNSVVLTRIYNDYCHTGVCQFIFDVFPFHTQIHFGVIKMWKSQIYQSTNWLQTVYCRSGRPIEFSSKL